MLINEKFSGDSNIEHFVRFYASGFDMSFDDTIKDFKARTATQNLDKFLYNTMDVSEYIITEWVNGSSLNHFYTSFSKYWTKDQKIMFVEVMTFQVLYSLGCLQDAFPGFRHNDLKADNVLICVTKGITEGRYFPSVVGYDEYQYKGTKYFIPNIGIRIKIADFGISEIINRVENGNTKNLQDYGITKYYNPYYDIHTFFNHLCTYTFKGDVDLQLYVNWIHKYIVPVEISGRETRNFRHVVLYEGRLVPHYVVTTIDKMMRCENKSHIFTKYRRPTSNSDVILNRFILGTGCSRGSSCNVTISSISRAWYVYGIHKDSDDDEEEKEANNP
jgi:serine/threonine protein kinase